MPDERQHLKKAERNETFAESLDLSIPPNAEWAITALFYAAVHLVEAYMAKVLSAHSADHKQRKQFMSCDRTMKNCFPEYRHLETLSRTCRYDAQPMNARDYTSNARPVFQKLKTKIH